MRSSVVIFTILASFFFGCHSGREITVDLSPYQDSMKLCINPYKGWYHHLYDNGVDKYLIRDDSVFRSFPGMDHLYIRIAWSYLEPHEGQFNWKRIDEVVEKYVPLGYGISFRITSKETGAFPGSVGEQKAGVQYAVPSWVRETGAEGRMVSMWNIRSWVPDWDDPVYLEKLDNFHKAFAERYDGKSWLRYVDVGSIGEWGEGHTHFSTKIPPEPNEVKAHINLYLKHYKKTQIVVTDDLLYYGKPENEVQDLLQYACEKGISLRDDSPMVDWYLKNNIQTWSVSHPHFYDSVFLKRPVVFELEHYKAVKENGNWLGKNGRDTLINYGLTGADIFREALKLLHATYIGYHGYAEDWIEQNPELTKELYNLCGYWYTVRKLSVSKEISPGESFIFSAEWMNRGVAPAYNDFTLQLMLQKDSIQVVLPEVASGNTQWFPGIPVESKYEFLLPATLEKGNWTIFFRLWDQNMGNRTIDLALSDSIRNAQGYFKLPLAVKVK